MAQIEMVLGILGNARESHVRHVDSTWERSDGVISMSPMHPRSVSSDSKISSGLLNGLNTRKKTECKESDCH